MTTTDIEAFTSLDTKCVNTIRCMGAALPQAANSGHPGAPMGCSAIAHVLWTRVMRFSANSPNWWNRDRFVLSNGHGCALLYTMLHLSGYDVTLSDLKEFRQLNSKTPGHPEANHRCPGVEVTTGPLGQGLSQAVGLAAASAHMAAQYNKQNGQTLFDNYTYVILGDGCVQEGVSSEACTLAAHWKLGRLICLYDYNKITIDGPTSLATSEDVASRFKAYGWDVTFVSDGDTNLYEICAAINAAKRVEDKPSLIVVHTTIGFGSQKQGTEKVHGAPLGMDDIKQLRNKFSLPSDDIWCIDSDVRTLYKERTAAMDEVRRRWETCLWKRYQEQYKTDADELTRRFSRVLPSEIESRLPLYTDVSVSNATRNLSHSALNSLASFMPEIVGGSADLTDSNKSDIKGAKDFSCVDYSGRYFRFGVREHAMCAIANGIYAFGGTRPFVATFLNFFGYAWGAIRLSALSRMGVLYIGSHDSIELGEDGPTHQPIEMLSLLRATPNLIEFRPADGRETNAAYIVWLSNPNTPTAICLCRSNTPTIAGSCTDKAQRGAYIIQDFKETNSRITGKSKRVVIGASGTEVAFGIKAKEILEADFSDITVRVVSMPSWTLFDEQPEEYKSSVIPPPDADTVLLYCEASVPLGCEKYGFSLQVAMDSFGASAPKDAVQRHFGFTAQNLANKVLQVLKRPLL